MPDVRELESRLAALRLEVAVGKRSGFTPSQLHKLRAECCQLWAALEQYKYEHFLDRAAARH